MRIVFDLDGTLADCEHRQHYINGDRKDWDAFFEACDKDAPIMTGLTALMALRHSMDASKVENVVEIWSGRGRGLNDSVLRKTLLWFDRHTYYKVMPAPRDYFRYVSHLPIRMRRHGDYTPDVDLKRGWLDKARAQDRAPQLVFDDRQKVVDMWRSEGVPCFQVAQGDF